MEPSSDNEIMFNIRSDEGQGDCSLENGQSVHSSAVVAESGDEASSECSNQSCDDVVVDRDSNLPATRQKNVSYKRRVSLTNQNTARLPVPADRDEHGQGHRDGNRRRDQHGSSGNSDDEIPMNRSDGSMYGRRRNNIDDIHYHSNKCQPPTKLYSRAQRRIPPPIKLETYSGEEDWREYLMQFEICANLGRWCEDEKIMALVSSLKGTARSYYANLPGWVKISYSETVSQFEMRFGNGDHQSLWQSKLEGRIRKPNEDIALLCDDLRKIVQRAYPDFDMRAQETLALKQLYRSLPDKVKFLCVDKECTRMNQAVNVISRYESVMGRGDGTRITSARMVTGSSPNGTDDAEPGVAKTLNIIMRRLDDLEGIMRKPLSNIECYGCGRLGHLVRDCRESQQRQQNKTRTKSTGQRGFRHFQEN